MTTAGVTGVTSGQSTAGTATGPGTTGVDGAVGGTGTDGSASGIDGAGTASDATDSTTLVPGIGPLGSPCTADSDCASLDCFSNALVPKGYCIQRGCNTAACPAGSSCLEISAGSFACLVDCVDHPNCAGLGVEICDTSDHCWIGAPKVLTDGKVGSPCESDADCIDANAQCYPEALSSGSWTGFVQGYCLINDCTASSCPAGSVCQPIYQSGAGACMKACSSTTDCRMDGGYGCVNWDSAQICWPQCNDVSTCPVGYACDDTQGVCIPGCAESGCPAGKVCGSDGICTDPPCTPGSCGDGYVCSEQTGKCVPGDVPTGPIPACDNLPAKDCVGTNAYCGEVLPFEPIDGPGYTNYPLNGETLANQYRSYARRDLMMLVKWATAYVDCKAASWGGGNGYPLGLGDMSEANGAIPGTAVGQPGHPPGTHVNGYDIDIAYYQNAGTNNYLKSVCDHVSGGKDQYHCVSPPYLMDVWRTALFIGALFTSSRTRVIGVDGKIGPLMQETIPGLCAAGWLPQKACSGGLKLAYETTDTGKGWFRFHHHHLHLSLLPMGSGKPGVPASLCKTLDCSPVTTGCEVH